jgi:hypothetical protein
MFFAEISQCRANYIFFKLFKLAFGFSVILSLLGVANKLEIPDSVPSTLPIIRRTDVLYEY